MSKCISSHGEYSEHEAATDFTCELCGVFDERAALDRIAALEAERDEARDHLARIPEDWRNAGRTLADMAIRADKAEARLARVTNDAFEMEMEQALEAANRWDSGYADAAAALPVILAVIRAVAADERPEHDPIKSMTLDEALNDLVASIEEVPDAERYPIGHRLCTQDCKQQEDGEHCFSCREPWPCGAADEQVAAANPLCPERVGPDGACARPAGHDGDHTDAFDPDEWEAGRG